VAGQTLPRGTRQAIDTYAGIVMQSTHSSCRFPSLQRVTFSAASGHEATSLRVPGRHEAPYAPLTTAKPTLCSEYTDLELVRELPAGRVEIPTIAMCSTGAVGEHHTFIALIARAQNSNSELR